MSPGQLLDSIILCLVWGLCFFTCIYSAHGTSDEETSSSSSEERKTSTDANKLLIIMLDGFRWDYYERQKSELRGFPLFLQEGVQTEWVEPVFPSLSYPAWTTISTGVYPENHGIIGNYMFDLKHSTLFELMNHTSTSRVHWWQNKEPIWITATRHNKRAFLRLWSRCDVPFNDIKPEVCSGFREARGIQAIRDTLNVAVKQLQQNFDLVMVYGEHLDNIGHQFGPDSEELKQAMRDVDDVIYDFLDKMTDTGLDEQVNVVIVGDHGMKWVGESSDTTYVKLSDYISDTHIYKILDKGAVVAISPYKSGLESVYESLKGHEGFDAYRRDEIPDIYRYKKSRLALEILLVAKPNYFIEGLDSPKQIPRELPNNRGYRGGTHGYPNMTEMRTIFFAKGPDFKKGLIHAPIHQVDIYQIFTELMGIPPEPHNGTWSKVAGMLVNDAVKFGPSSLLIPFGSVFILQFIMNLY